MPEPYRVLFICTGNACRSQMAEALLRDLDDPRFEARSAGSDPAGYIHPVAIETLRRMNVSLEGQYSKGWDEFADDENHIIITVCDHAASQPCPTWPGHPATAHWPLPDPSFVSGTEEDRVQLATQIANLLKERILKLIKLPLDRLTSEQVRTELARIEAE